MNLSVLPRRREIARTVENMAFARGVAARLVAMDRKYLPIFDTLDKALADMQAKESTITRALAIAEATAPILAH